MDVRGEVVLLNVCCTAGELAAERHRILQLLTSTAELAVRQKAILVVIGDFSCVAPGDASIGYASDY